MEKWTSSRKKPLYPPQWSHKTLLNNATYITFHQTYLFFIFYVSLKKIHHTLRKQNLIPKHALYYIRKVEGREADQK